MSNISTMKKNIVWIALCGILLSSCSQVEESSSDLQFPTLATTWDEGIPLGNATIGELVWQKGTSLRLSLDRTDLWDCRAIPELSDTSMFNYRWIKEQVAKQNYDIVRTFVSDHKHPAPSKIPGAALEFPIASFGEVATVQLHVRNALCRIEWKDGTSMESFVHATEPVGWFIFRNVKDKDFNPTLIAPQYNYSDPKALSSDQTNGKLQVLGYEQGTVLHEGNRITYHQKGWGEFSYDVVVEWKQTGSTITGVWSITSSENDEKAAEETALAMRRGVRKDYREHMKYWDAYWAQSSVSLPDPVLQKQYDNEMYKFGSTSREHSIPISLQAVWTADNGELPPWRGDFHNDLNTQLSYWPAYTGNHLSEGQAFLNWMWDCRDTFRHYARHFFEVDGLMVPGVSTIKGEPLIGWTQYTYTPTAAAWMAHHFYLHWKYSADDVFLRERAYPFLHDVAVALEGVTQVDSTGVRTLELSATPEIYNDSPRAWFHTITNFDLSLIRFGFKAAAEVASAMGKTDETQHWNELLSQMPYYDLDEDGALTFAHGFPYNESHRHFSHAMSIHPLGLIDWSDGAEAQRIIRATIGKLDAYGPDWWCGYSYSWMGNMKARAMDGEGAAQALRTFAECFCLPNTFHANGDQTRTGKSKFTYRPFTLEGNFAFASGIQEMLLQSHTGTIRIFPAIPVDWKDVSFTNLRAMGAFLVSATMKGGELSSVRVYSEKGGTLRIQLPTDTAPREYATHAGQWITVE